MVNILISSSLHYGRYHCCDLIKRTGLLESQPAISYIWHTRWNVIYHHMAVIFKKVSESFDSLVFMKKNRNAVMFQFSFALPGFSGELSCWMCALYVFQKPLHTSNCVLKISSNVLRGPEWELTEPWRWTNETFHLVPGTAWLLATLPLIVQSLFAAWNTEGLLNSSPPFKQSGRWLGGF